MFAAFYVISRSGSTLAVLILTYGCSQSHKLLFSAVVRNQRRNN